MNWGGFQAANNKDSYLPFFSLKSYTKTAKKRDY